MHHFCRYFTMAWHGFIFLLSFQAFIDSRKLQNRTAKTLWKGRSFWFVCNKEILSKQASKAASTQSAKWFCVHARLQLQVFEVFSAALMHKGAFWRVFCLVQNTILAYHKVASSNTSRLEAHAGSGSFRLFVKGIFDPYALWPFPKKLIS